ncbi:MAG: hypothetical protein SGJ23_08645 [Alphaproteobacteria bacterium]|nr:hypothetical protein [Alphaproteobacteria bacterium]
MHIMRPPDFSAQIADALANLRLWFLSVIEWLAEFAPLPRDARLWLQRQLIHTRRELRVVLAAAVVARMRFVERPHRRSHRRKMPRGFRWAHRCAPAVRFFTRGIKLRTLKNMRRAVDDFDALVTRAFARLPRGLRGGVLVMTFASAPQPAPFTIAPAAEAADTS